MRSSYDAKSSDSVAGLVWCPRTYRYPRRKWAGLGEVLVVMVVVVVVVVIVVVVQIVVVQIVVVVVVK